MLINTPAHTHSHSSHETCEYHKKHPGANWAGCTCSSSLWNCDKITHDEDKLKLILTKAKEIENGLFL